MGEANKIIRNSIHAFFNGYSSFISIAALLVFPFSASLLISQSFIISSPYALRFISLRLNSLFQAASFPDSSRLFSLLNLMLSQTTFSTVFTLPFTLTFLLLAKAFIIQITREKAPSPFSSTLNQYFCILLTHLFNSFLVISANATIFILFFLIFNTATLIGLPSSVSLIVMSSAGAILYSIVIANTVVTCNLAIIVSAIEKISGYLSVLKASVLIRGRFGTALSITLPTNLLMAAIEALFQYRVMVQYHISGKLNLSIIFEAITIACMHSVIIVIEIIASFMFYKSCKLDCKENFEFEPEEKGLV